MKLMKHCIALALVILQAACQPAYAPTEYILFLDLSASISAAQRNAWLGAAAAVLEQMSFGDSIAIFPIHDRTSGAAPLFRARVPDKGLSLEDIAHAKEILEKVRQDGSVALREALSSNTRSHSTELLEIVNKLASTPNEERKVSRRVFIFSDFLHSTRDLDLEKTRLADYDLDALILDIQKRYRWTKDALRGDKIYGVLSATTSGGPRPVNDHAALKQFWGTLFNQLGAELASFDTYLNLDGGQHVADTHSSSN
jgi:hypothetical protein